MRGGSTEGPLATFCQGGSGMNGRHAGGEVGEAGREGVRFCLLDALNTLAHRIPLEGLLLAHLVLDARDEEGDDA